MVGPSLSGCSWVVFFERGRAGIGWRVARFGASTGQARQTSPTRMGTRVGAAPVIVIVIVGMSIMVFLLSSGLT